MTNLSKCTKLSALFDRICFSFVLEPEDGRGLRDVQEIITKNKTADL